MHKLPTAKLDDRYSKHDDFWVLELIYSCRSSWSRYVGGCTACYRVPNEDRDIYLPCSKNATLRREHCARAQMVGVN